MQVTTCHITVKIPDPWRPGPYLERQMLQPHFGDTENVTQGLALGPPPFPHGLVLHGPKQLLLPQGAVFPVVLQRWGAMGKHIRASARQGDEPSGRDRAI